ncbi:MAG: hypothetical protein JW741_05940 [Sedimentisphaerales bacterium]|nr:hypothetical protein [Sedimentisphaerales bacterium]
MVDEKGPVLPFGSLLFPRLFQAFRMSIQPTKLILAFLALATICLAGRVMDFSQTVVVSPSGTTELDEYVLHGGEVSEHIERFQEAGGRRGVFTTLWNFGAKRFHAALIALSERDVLEVTGNIVACFAALAWAFQHHPAYSLLLFALVLAVMSLAGGAICRVAALQFAQGQKPGLTEAVRFGSRKFQSFFTAPLTPVAIILVMGLCIFLLGLIGNIPVLGELSVGLLLPLAFMGAALVTVIAIGALVGLNLMFPAIAYEDSDCFDAISRSFSYVYAKPWRIGFYTSLVAVYGAICYAFVRFFCFSLLLVTHLFLRVGFLQGNEKLDTIWPGVDFTNFLGAASVAPEAWSAWLAYYLIRIWVLVVVGLMVSFVISFYFSANTIIYALMRKGVDKVALDEVYTPSDEMATRLADVPSITDSAGEEAAAEPEGADNKSETSE